MLMRYTTMRIVQLIPLILVVTIVVFFVMMIVPGDPVMVMLGAVDGAQVSREVYDAMRLRLGLDQPLIVQYLHWLSNVLQGDLGTSITYRTSALEVILLRMVPTAYLMVGGLILAVIIAVPGGVLAAIHNKTKWDHLLTGFVVLGISVPTFWLALVAVLIFAVYLGWLPAIGYTRPQEDFLDFLKHIALPMSVVALNIAATVLRFQRQDFLEQMNQDYVRTARAKGLTETVVLWKHVLRNSLMTTFTVVGLQMAYLSGLITIVESVFNYPGIGYLLLNSIRTRDFIVVQGVVLFMVFLVIIVNLLVDILYTVIDPRIRYSKGWENRHGSSLHKCRHSFRTAGGAVTPHLAQHRCVRRPRSAFHSGRHTTGSLHFH